MALVQITERKGFVRRVPAGESPCVELDLEPNQEIVRFECREMIGGRERVTYDWSWRAWVATRL